MGLKLGALELCSRFEAERGRRSQGDCSKQLCSISIFESALFVDTGIHFSCEVFMENNFSGDPPPFVTKVVGFYWHGYKLSAAGREFPARKAKKMSKCENFLDGQVSG